MRLPGLPIARKQLQVDHHVLEGQALPTRSGVRKRRLWPIPGEAKVSMGVSGGTYRKRETFSAVGSAEAAVPGEETGRLEARASRA